MAKILDQIKGEPDGDNYNNPRGLDEALRAQIDDEITDAIIGVLNARLPGWRTLKPGKILSDMHAIAIPCKQLIWYAIGVDVPTLRGSAPGGSGALDTATTKDETSV